MTDNLANDQVINQNENPTDVIANETPTEKLVPQSKVNELYSQGFHKGYQKALNERSQYSTAQSEVNGMSVEDVNKLVNDQLKTHLDAIHQEALKKQQEAEGTRILHELGAKIDADRKEIPDFEDVTKQVDFSKHPVVLHYANLTDNAGHVLYDLAKNPIKIAQLEQASPDIAALEIKRLSDSIKMNKNAANTKLPPSPNSSLRPSNIGINKGPVTAGQFRDAYKGRG